MPQALGRIKETILDSSGNAIVGISVELRRQGATVNGDQSGASPLTVAVFDLGGVVDGDVVAMDTGTSQIAVSAVSIANRTIELSGFVGTLSLDDGARITPIGSLPVVYLDLALANSGTNPLTTDSKGDALSNASDVAYAPYGYYDYLISGDDADGNTVTTELVRDFYVPAISPFPDASSARDGVKIDNVTDDGVSLNNALADLSRTSAGLYGGTKELPKGILLTTVQIVIPPRITLRGSGHRSTQIQADTGFPTSTAVVHMGNTAGSSYEYGMGLLDIGVICSGISGSIGIESTTANQCTSIRRVVVSRYVSRGISLTTDYCNNFTIAEVDLLHEDAATTAIGIYMDVGTSIRMSDISFNAHDGATNSTAQAILMAGSCSLSASRIYVERYATGLSVGAGCRAFVDTIQGTADTTTALLHMDSLANGLTALNIIQGGATNAIKNDRDSHTGSIAHGGFYIATDDGAAGLKTILSSSPSFQTTFAGPVRDIGIFSLGPRQDLTTATSVTLPSTGNYFRLTGATTPIDNISARDAGSVIILESEAAAATNIVVRDVSGSGGNIYLAGSTSFTLTAGDKDTLTLLCDGTNWIQIGNSNN